MQVFHAGDVVRARGDRWRVVDSRGFDECQLVTIAGAGLSNLGAERRLLVPFDTVEHAAPSDSTRPPRRVGGRHWRRALCDLVFRAAQGELRSLVSANVELLPHQLEPALAAVRGLGSRFLLADDVGLGKTIQAGAIVAELRARGVADRVLVLTPPGLREQWAQELSDRFGVRAAIVHFRAVRERVALLRTSINPWTTWPVAIASIDYVKRPEVLRDVVARPWDIVVVDEAHRVANDGGRHDAVSTLASHASYVILLTATPHSGDTRAFESLCGIGSYDDRLLVFRRTRQVLTDAPVRRVHRLRVRASRAERQMHARLDDFERAVRAERGETSRDTWIALAVLRKRAFSSARALGLSVERRLNAMSPAAAGPSQLLLPLDDHGESDAADEPPAWHAMLALQNSSLERRLLTSLSAAAAAATAHETKLTAIARLIRRVSEPLIVFTEYRDTLIHVARSIREPVAVLHGGLSRLERAAALRAFREGNCRILLATDAAGEGLNLHHLCRVVVNLELPWNPMRLEQRIGRVDRIGQRRTVHAFHLLGSGTREEQLLAGLESRIAQAQAEAGAPDPLGTREHVAPISAPSLLEPLEVTTEVNCLRVLRRLETLRAPHGGDRGRALVTRARLAETRACLGTRALFIWELQVEDRRGRVAGTRVVSVMGRLPSGLSSQGALRVLASSVEAQLAPLLEAAALDWRDQAIENSRSFLQTRLSHERSIALSIGSGSDAGFQPGLFDQRAAHAECAAQAARLEVSASIAQRIAVVEAEGALESSPPRLRLVLLP